MSNTKVWSTFVSNKNSNLEFRIQDLPSHRLDDAVEFYMAYQITHEPIEKAAGISKSEQAMAEGREVIDQWIRSSLRIAICCLKSDSESDFEIIGLSAVELSSNESSKQQMREMKSMVQSKETKKFFEIMDGLYNMHSALDKYDSEQYWSGRGVCVRPEYRGHGIAQEFLSMRRSLCKADGLPMTIAWMTSLGTQKAADRDGWQTVFEVKYEDLGKQYGVTFEDGYPYCKLMIARV